MTPKLIAPADPATRWTAAHRGPAFFVYPGLSGQVPDRYRARDHRRFRDDDSDPSGRSNGSQAMIDRSLECFDLYPTKLIGDAAYGTAEMLNWLVKERGVEPHIPVFDNSQRTDGTFSCDDFACDRGGD